MNSVDLVEIEFSLSKQINVGGLFMTSINGVQELCMCCLKARTAVSGIGLSECARASFS